MFYDFLCVSSVILGLTHWNSASDLDGLLDLGLLLTVIILLGSIRCVSSGITGTNALDIGRSLLRTVLLFLCKAPLES